MTDTIIDSLKKKLHFPLPGIAAQLKMAHATRRHLKDIADTKPVLAAVLAVLFPKNGEWHILLIERRKVDGDKHSGQIGFPGGKSENGDGNLMITALRETEEELGINRQDISILGALTELYIPVSNFLVHPFVGYLTYPPTYQLQQNEVDGVLEIPLSHFLDISKRKSIDIRISSNLILKNVPYYDVNGKVLWGATAMMLSELTELIMEVA